MNAGVLQRLDQRIVRHSPVPQRQIVPHRAAKQEDVLIDIADRGGSLMRPEVFEWLPIQPDFPDHGAAIPPSYGRRALAAAGAAHQRDARPGSSTREKSDHRRIGAA